MPRRKLTIREQFMQHRGIGKFLQDCENFNMAHEPFYTAYPEFVAYFSSRSEITKHDMVIGINFTYGWMPTIMDFRSDKLEEGVIILNKAKSGVIPERSEIELLKSLFNNSVVGTSKLLHFINPVKFPIWDSRVRRYLTGNDSVNMGKIEPYFEYIDLMKDLVNTNGFCDAHNSICKKAGYEFSKFRAAELVMYLNGSR